MTKEKLIERIVTRTQSKYEVVKKDITQQNSYNLSLFVEGKMSSFGAIRSLNDGSGKYVIADDYKIELSDSIIKIIGENYRNKNNRLVLVHTEDKDGATPKFQIRRTDNKNEENEWFLKLYDRNIEGATFTIEIDERNKIIFIDNKVPIMINEYSVGLSETENYDEEILSSVIKKYYDTHGASGIHLFGIDYYKIILENQLNKNTILEKSNLESSYIAELNKGINIGKILFERSNIENKIKFNNASVRVSGFNKIFYGIPGCGKSYKISAMLSYKEKFQEEANRNGIYASVKPENIFRTTFYLDYSNSDFIGQIYPTIVKDEDGKQSVIYKNVPGPFTKALANAHKKPTEMIYLVIEEINRGNAAAIFGDTFQLLDRLKEDNENYLAGDSEYPITNEFIESYFKEQGIDISKKIYIPRNLTILATMNTSDQNVFPLDTAFKRRWDKERVVGDWGTCAFAKKFIPFTGITWENFADVINSKIVNNTENGMTEDKKMGCYFATEDMFTDLPYTKDSDKLTRFVNNVIDYLFNDVSKFDHEVLFNKELKSFDSIDERIKDIKEERKEFTVLFDEQLGFIQVNLEKIEVDDKHE